MEAERANRIGRQQAQKNQLWRAGFLIGQRLRKQPRLGRDNPNLAQFSDPRN